MAASIVSIAKANLNSIVENSLADDNKAIPIPMSNAKNT
jgi:hypothetical protein